MNIRPEFFNVMGGGGVPVGRYLYNTDSVEMLKDDLAQLRAELDRMAAAVKHADTECMGGYYECPHCGAKSGSPEHLIHKDDCPVREAENIREKYGFDKKGES